MYSYLTSKKRRETTQKWPLEPQNIHLLWNKVWTLLKIIYGLLECFVFAIFFRGEFIPKLSEDKQFPGELCGAWTTMFGRLDQASECTKLFAAQLLNPFIPGDFAEKCVFELVELFSGHCLLLRAKTYHKVLYRSYTLRPSDLDTKY